MDGQNDLETEDWTLMDLPQEVIHMLLSYLPFKDLMKCRRVCTAMLKFIENDNRLLSDARLEMVWPTCRNHRDIKKAAQAGNFEAQLKLALTYIYDGAQAKPLGFGFDLRWQESNKLFEMIDDRLSPCMPPISWIFYRPPYRSFSECCKINIFRTIGTKVTTKPWLHEKFSSRDLYVTCRLLGLMPDRYPTSHRKALLKRIIKKNSCAHASLLLLRTESEEPNSKRGKQVQEKAMELRQILTRCPQSYEAQLALCIEYAAGRYGCLTEDATDLFVRNIFAQSTCGFRDCSQTAWETSFEKNRLLVVSWMIEVADEHYSTDNVLHVAIDIFDRFISRQPVDSWQLQLVGITALTISTRMLEVVPFTITWAAWLTDNTYDYMDVVRMMGHMVATLSGQLQMWKALDYVSLLLKKSGTTDIVNFMVMYLLEKAHLVLDLRCQPQACVAAACFQLALVILNRTKECWPKSLQKLTGFSSEFVAKTTMLLYKNIFVVKRGTKVTEALKITRIKYAFDEYQCVSIRYWREPSFFEICQLGHHEGKLEAQQCSKKGAANDFCCVAAKFSYRANRRRLRKKKIYKRVNKNLNKNVADNKANMVQLDNSISK